MLAKKKEVDNYRREVEQYLACERNPVRMQNAQDELDRVPGAAGESLALRVVSLGPRHEGVGVV